MNAMESYITVGAENSTPVELYYEDHGWGRPVVLIHGWPLSGTSWENQHLALLDAGHRVITYDCRGFGRSSKPSVGYRCDTLAADLHVLLRTLNLADASLVGFSMGTGTVARYLASYGTDRIRKAVLISTLGPYLLKTPDNPDGVDASVFDGFKVAIVDDRAAFLQSFLHDFYNIDDPAEGRVSEYVIRDTWNVAVGASSIATLACVDTWIEDFRADLPRNDVPTLILHGDSDRLLPLRATASRQVSMLSDARLVMLRDGPHGVLRTHAQEINKQLVEFLA